MHATHLHGCTLGHTGNFNKRRVRPRNTRCRANLCSTAERTGSVSARPLSARTSRYVCCGRDFPLCTVKLQLSEGGECLGVTGPGQDSVVLVDTDKGSVGGLVSLLRRYAAADCLESCLQPSSVGHTSWIDKRYSTGGP